MSKKNVISITGKKRPRSKNLKNSAQKSAEERYDKKTDLEHVLLRPDTYVGGIEKLNSVDWILNNDGMMERKKLNITPAAYKVVDEILVNARDQSVRDSTCTKITVNIDPVSGYISVKNNGNGIPIRQHSQHNNTYIPQMVFADFKSGENYDDSQNRIVGGRNGYGAKLTNAYSEHFKVTTVDGVQNLKWEQEFKNNMSNMSEPKITKYTKVPFTKIEFKLDYNRLGMAGLESDLVELIERRVYDLAGCTDERVNIYLNGVRLKTKSFEKYIDLYLGNARSGKRVYLDMPNTLKSVTGDIADSKWNVAVAVSDDGFQHTSFVNGIATTSGGKHVDYIANKIVSKLKKKVETVKKNLLIKPSYVKDQLWLFLNATVVNPSFGSQTKEELKTNQKNFKFTCNIPDSFINDLEERFKISLRVQRLAQFKENDLSQLSETDGKKVKKLRGIPKLEDASMAGTKESSKCTLIITEGDSAKTFALSGQAVVGKRFWGVYPVRGKILNLKSAKASQLLKNEEYSNIKKILGLKEGEVYNNTSKLRYGSVMFLTDQDLDGFHIKGLGCNIFHSMWPSLLKIPGFIKCFITPLVVAKRGSGKDHQRKEFFNEQEFEIWRDGLQEGDLKKWNIGYFKGLGTSTPADARRYFSNKEMYIRDYYCQNEKKSFTLIDEAFSVKHISERKKWILNYDHDSVVDYSQPRISYEDMMQRELLHFFEYDVRRSICNVMDGLKTSQRKILWAMRKVNHYTQIKKVDQVAAKVSEISGYHHGEMSLKGAIVGMAQIYAGANGINLLLPSGQFGSRVKNGHDAASSRYINTKLNSIAKTIFPIADDPLLDYEFDDDKNQIEPRYYVPIIPMVLVNGCEGIGTGFSTSIVKFNPKEVIENVRRKIQKKKIKNMLPWFNYFKGDVKKVKANHYTVHGKWNRISATSIKIHELPVGAKNCKSFEQFKEFLEKCLMEKKRGAKLKETKKQFLLDYTVSKMNDMEAEFLLEFNSKSFLEQLINSGELESRLNLVQKITTTNMHAFDTSCKIKKYSSIDKIFDEFYQKRYELYGKRKELMMNNFEAVILELFEKVRFLRLVLTKELDIDSLRVWEDEKLFAYLVEKEFHTIGDSYNYLLNMPIRQLTKTQMEKLEKQLALKREELDQLRKITVEQWWLEELDKLDEDLDALWEENSRILLEDSDKQPGPKKRRRKK